MEFTRKYNTCSESNNEDISEEELDETYRLLLAQWKKYFLREEKQKKTVNVLLLENEKLGTTIVVIKEEITLLKLKLNNMNETDHMLNKGSNMLADMSKGKSVVNKKVESHSVKNIIGNVKTSREPLVKHHAKINVKASAPTSGKA
ncbi:hypothetical protein KIW84_062772 [Lathyrus oleraceus]|uniref:Uncharacterized protein n=1 Tax=Pisum sativum TaxID=3888 RepID=A0A9D5A6B3_PEA|nr:hypothetical protein KIW84_062772 [Pisum sativum]